MNQWEGFPRREPEPDEQLEPETAVPRPVDDPELEAVIADPVLQWRCKVFLDLGMTLRQARILAVARPAPDLNRARHMVAAGCDPHVAFDILA
jgi:hypothetical protein